MEMEIFQKELIGEILLRHHWVDSTVLQNALEAQKDDPEPVGEILVSRGQITRSRLYQALAEQYQVDFMDKNEIHLDPHTVSLVPLPLVIAYRMVPVADKNGYLTVAVSETTNLSRKAVLGYMIGIPNIRMVLVTDKDMDSFVSYFKFLVCG